MPDLISLLERAELSFTKASYFGYDADGRKISLDGPGHAALRVALVNVRESLRQALRHARRDLRLKVSSDGATAGRNKGR